MTVTSAKLSTTLASHSLWLRDNGGSRANLSGADLPGANLPWADLSRADLSGANLPWADLSRADLSRADLSGANLSRADLSGADLSGADLSGANLSWANLSRAKDVIDGGQRFDGYRFVGWIKDGALMIRARCRDFTIAQARAHWFSKRGGTPLGDETMAILDHIERVAVVRGLISTPDSQKENES